MKAFFASGKYFILIDYLLYVALIIITGWTVYQLVNAPVKERLTQMRYRIKLKRSRITKKEVPLSKRSSLYRNIYFLLQSIKVSSNKHEPGSVSVYGFITFSICLGLLTFVLLLVKFQDAVVGLLVSSIVLVIPYTVLLVRLRGTRNTIGNSLISVLEILVHAYNASSNDMYQALKLTHASIKEPELRRLFIKLISDLQTSSNEEELRETIDLFIYTCGNLWAMRLGNIILKSYLHQENVLNALLQLQNQMINNAKMLEEEKAESFDAFTNSLLALVLFPVSLVGGYFVVRPRDWLHFQFGEKTTLFVFILTSVMVVVAFLVGLIIRKPKNDL
ncbi:hypothetical protein ACFYKX_25505 [Cytobacillus sp. FJAT-54145]|uniref:Type II secretion system protein GspF domain-containing protein n=1 Tax=Cytobacillus spartinae TaxID=3299023 RepID=A0ABW6KI58_9BACI